MRKKGVSVIVGYVLLVVIAISISLLVYSWLKGLLPGEPKKCPDSVALIIEDYNCSDKELYLILKNKGFFNINGSIVRIRNESDGFFYELKNKKGEIFNFFARGLKPDEKDSYNFSYAEYNKIIEIEIEPFIFTDKGYIFCDNAIIRQEIVGCE